MKLAKIRERVERSYSMGACYTAIPQDELTDLLDALEEAMRLLDEALGDQGCNLENRIEAFLTTHGASDE